MAYISFEEVKEILKKSIDETTNINEALEKTVQFIYLKGYKDGGLIVKGMEMPKICDYCPMCKFYPEKVEVWCNAKNRLCHKGHRSERIPDWCPLIEVKKNGMD